MSILKFFVRAISVVPDELSRYFSHSKDGMSSITANRGFVSTKKMLVKVPDNVKIESKEKVTVKENKKAIEDGPVL